MPDAAVEGARGPTLCPAVQRLHRLGWMPGAVMHPGWWDYLGLKTWRDDYQRHAGCRRALDALIVQRRGFPEGPLPATVSDEQRRMLAMEPRLPQLVIALGVVAAGSPELLMLGEYRRQLVAALGVDACDQLAALLHGRRCPPPGEPPARLLHRLREQGRSWLDRTLPGSVVWQALSVTLPPPATAVGIPPTGLALPMLFRLERLL